MIFKKEPISTRYWKLFSPLLVEQLFMMLIGNVNVLLLSFYNDQAVAATGLADQILAIGTMAMGIISLGSTIIFLQNADESRLDYVRGAARQTFVLNLLLGFVLLMITVLFGNLLMGLMQTPAELKDMSVLYLRIVSGSLIFQGISTSVSALLRSFGKVNRAMTVSIINTLITIIGNSIVILTPFSLFGEGIIGISVATVVTRFIGAVISVMTVRKTLPAIWDGLFALKLEDFQIGKEILKLGIPSGMENVSYNLSQTIITAVIASFGATAINAKIYTQTITAVVFTVSVAAGQALQIILGKYLRENRLKEAEEFTFQVTKTFMGIGFIINLFLAIFGYWIAQIFTSNPDIIHLVQILLWMNLLYDPSRVGNEILIAGLNVTGDVRYPVVIGILVTYLFTVPASILLGGYLQFGILIVWTIFILDEGTRALIFANRWKNGEWQKHLKE